MLAEKREYLEQRVRSFRWARPAATHPNVISKMRGLVAGTLDQWLGKENRHYLIDALFGGEGDHSGSTRNLDVYQLAVLLEWMHLDRDRLNGYVDSPASQTTQTEMQAIVHDYLQARGQLNLLNE